MSSVNKSFKQAVDAGSEPVHVHEKITAASETTKRFANQKILKSTSAFVCSLLTIISQREGCGWCRKILPLGWKNRGYFHQGITSKDTQAQIGIV